MGRAAIVVGLLAALLAMGMAGGAPGWAGERPAAVKVGGTLAVTGPFAPEWGPGMLDFMRAYERIINGEGGIFLKEVNARLPLQLVVYDDESNPEKSVELYEKLAAVDKVHAFIGPGSSPITLRASTVAERLKIPMMTGEANSPVIYSRGFQWIVGVDRPAYFWSEHYFNLLRDQREKGKIHYKTIAFLIEDHPHTKDCGQGAQDFAQKAGFQVLGTETVPFRTKDFSAAIARFKSLNPDILYVAAWTFTSVPFVKQAHELGLKPQELHTIHMLPEFIRDVSPQLAEGTTGESHLARKALDARLQAILKALKVDDPYAFKSLTTPIRYLAMEALRRGIEAAGTLDREKLMAALRANQFDMPYGPHRVNFNIPVAGRILNGTGEKYLFPAQVQNGRIVAVGPPRFADGEYRPSPRK